MKYFVYILKSQKDNKYYIGQTLNLDERINAHQRGSVKSTKSRRPLELIYSESSVSYNEARRREIYFKKYKNTNKLLEQIKLAPSSKGCDTPTSRGDRRNEKHNRTVLVNKTGPIV